MPATSFSDFPKWLPASTCDVEEKTAQATLRKLQRCEVYVPLMQRSLQTAYFETGATGNGRISPPVVLLSSFNASCLEFRMLMPLLEAAGAEAYAVDIVGWGFTESKIEPGAKEELGPAERRAHLLAFCQKKIKRPAVLVGSSLNASTVVDFALHHPEATAKLVLMGPAAWNEGLGVFPWLPRWAATLITQVWQVWQALRTLHDAVVRRGLNGLRQACISCLMLCNTKCTCLPIALHGSEPTPSWTPGHLSPHLGWGEAIMAFARGGGYHLRAQMPKLAVETLVLWGRNDRFVNPRLAVKYEEHIKRCQVVWLEECGHWPNFEHPKKTADWLLQFVRSGLPVDP